MNTNKLEILKQKALSTNKKMFLERIEWSPEMAQEMLDNYRKTDKFQNRSIKINTTEMLKREILANKWNEFNCPFHINSEFILVNGQHRLEAIVQSGKTVHNLTVFNYDEWQTLDNGNSRSINDQFKMDKDFECPTKKLSYSIATVQQVMRLERTILGSTKSTKQELEKLYRQKQASFDFILKSLEDNKTFSRAEPKGVLAWLHSIPKYTKDVEEFINVFKTEGVASPNHIRGEYDGYYHLKRFLDGGVKVSSNKRIEPKIYIIKTLQAFKLFMTDQTQRNFGGPSTAEEQLGFITKFSKGEI